MEKKGISCFAFSFDVSDEAAVMENVDRIEKSIGPVNILLNNASDGEIQSVKKGQGWKNFI